MTETFGPNAYILKLTEDGRLIETYDKSFAPPNGGTETSVYAYINGILTATRNRSKTNYKVENLTNNALVLSYDDTMMGSNSTDYYTLTFAR
jgi:hypothetical protein